MQLLHVNSAVNSEEFLLKCLLNIVQKLFRSFACCCLNAIINCRFKMKQLIPGNKQTKSLSLKCLVILMITATKKVLEFTRILMFHRDSSEFIMILMVTATKKVLEFTRILLFNRDSSEFIVKSRLRYIYIYSLIT